MQQVIVLLSDIHANEAAFDAVMDDARSYVAAAYGQPGTLPLRVWCLGDLAGRGPVPLVLKRLQRLHETQSDFDRSFWLAGNHDWMVLGKISPYALSDNRQTRKEFSSLGGMDQQSADVACFHRRDIEVSGQTALLNWLEQLPTHQNQPQLPGLYVAHGQYFIQDGVPDSDHAVATYSHEIEMSLSIRNLRQYRPDALPQVLLIGHTHIAGVWVWSEERSLVESSGLLPNQGARVFTNLAEQPIVVNPGSVGFPRPPLTCPTYAILAFEAEPKLTSISVELRAVPYDYTQNTFPTAWILPNDYLKELQRCSSG